jgi:hypothetical protein
MFTWDSEGELFRSKFNVALDSEFAEASLDLRRHFLEGLPAVCGCHIPDPTWLGHRFGLTLKGRMAMPDKGSEKTEKIATLRTLSEAAMRDHLMVVEFRRKHIIRTPKLAFWNGRQQSWCPHPEDASSYPDAQAAEGNLVIARQRMFHDFYERIGEG